MGKKRALLGKSCRYFSIFVIVMLLLGYFCILLYNVSQDIPVLQTYYVDSYDPKNQRPIPIPDIVFRSGIDFNVSCSIGTASDNLPPRDCSDSIISIVANDISSGKPVYVKIFHKPNSNLEFQLEKHIKDSNDNSVSFVGFNLIYSTPAITIQLFDKEYNPFLGKEEDLINFNFDKYDVFDKSVALLNHYLLPLNQKVNMYFSRSLTETIDNSNTANIFGFPPKYSPRYLLSTRVDIPVINDTTDLQEFRLFLSSTVLTQIRQKRVATIYAAFSMVGGLWSPLAGAFFFLFRKSLVDEIFPCITTIKGDDDKDEYNEGDKSGEI